ncbi:MAG TPA: zf-HC2 domain-containing protein [Mycobacterium sp.]|uniref:anti-sigma factor family protein n=1 Tax=Mycobacterium sp. TaxID=1785 RepID=UPI002B7CF9B8|nr:zf-HC2 domain-containing protein [Mycobacterium sp.]HME80265.1 zf-HC2 domain-containing protein [Mycobacterium sp.]
MRLIQGFGPTGDSDLPAGDSHEYATWDAAYVLGSLSPADRREFEAHLSVCPPCTQAVAELSGMPALLSKLDSATVAAINDQTAEPPMAPNLLPSLMFAVRRRRQRTRLATWSSAAAAAAVLTVGAFVGISSHSLTSPTAQTSQTPQASASALPMVQIATKELASTVSFSSQNWGTVIDLRCVCLAPAYAHHDRLAMVVVSRDGTHTQLATWVADPGHTATPTGSISIPVDQIAAVQVVSADNGKVLLERSL